MASSPAVQHRERTAKAHAFMETLGLKRSIIGPVLKQLLKTYNNEWDFIEAENYRLLADHIFDQQEAQTSKTSSQRGPVTRGRRPNSGADADCADGSPFTPAKARPADEFPSSSARAPAAANHANATPARSLFENPSTAARATNPPVQQRTRPDDEVKENVARAVEYHSGASVRSRAAILNEREKGKSPMVETPRLTSPPKIVSVKIEVCPGRKVGEGFENLTFEKVDGVIVPAVRKSQTEGVMAAEEGQLVVANPGLVKAEPVDNRLCEVAQVKICAPPPPPVAALLESNPTLTMVHVKNELAETDGNLHCNGSKSPEEEILLKEAAAAHASNRPQNPPKGTSELVKALPLADQPLVIIAGPTVAQRSEVGGDRNNPVALVDYDSEDEPVELGPQGVSLEGCDLALIPEEAVEHVDVPLNSEEIRPKFILDNKEGGNNGCEDSRPSKRDLAELEKAAHSKRQKCDVEVPAAPPLENGHTDPDRDVHTPVSNATSKRKQVVSDSPSPGPGNLASSNVTQPAVSSIGARRRLIVAESPSPEKEVPVELPVALLKRVKIEPGLEDPNGLPKKKKPRQDPAESPPQREKSCHNPADIARGTEKFPIPFVNDYTSETIPWNFKYIRNNVVTENAYINISLARIGDEDCCSRCADDCLKAPQSCPCTRETGGDYAYSKDGLLKPRYLQSEMDRIYNSEVKKKHMCYCPSGWDCPIERTKNEMNPEGCKGHMLRRFVKECWHKCGCSMQCGNRVVQRGISRKLQVFFTKDGKGWGLGSKEDLPAGSFVCEYVGEIITNMELDNRNEETKEARKRQGHSGQHKDTYPVLLDGDWVSEKGLKDEEALCLDATNYGNVARFINHRCFDANLIDIPVTFDSQDRHYYHIAFFTNRDVSAGEELTWDYKIDFDDNDHPIEAFKCLCKSKLCRGVTTKQK